MADCRPSSVGVGARMNDKDVGAAVHGLLGVAQGIELSWLSLIARQRAWLKRSVDDSLEGSDVLSENTRGK
jgi:hypothetical protein